MCIGPSLPPKFPSDTQKRNGSLEPAAYLATVFEKRQGLINHCLDRPGITFWKVQNVEKQHSHFLQ